MVRRLAGRLSPRQLAELAAHVDAEEAAKGGPDAASLRLATEFHVRLAEMTGRPTLSRYVRETAYRSCLSLAAFGRPHSSECAISEHREVLAALEAGDEARAAELMAPPSRPGGPARPVEGARSPRRPHGHPGALRRHGSRPAAPAPEGRGGGLTRRAAEGPATDAGRTASHRRSRGSSVPPHAGAGFRACRAGLRPCGRRGRGDPDACAPEAGREERTPFKSILYAFRASFRFSSFQNSMQSIRLLPRSASGRSGHSLRNIPSAAPAPRTSSLFISKEPT